MHVTVEVGLNLPDENRAEYENIAERLYDNVGEMALQKGELANLVNAADETEIRLLNMEVLD